MEFGMRRKVLIILILGSMAFSAGVGDIIERNNAAIENERRQYLNVDTSKSIIIKKDEFNRLFGK